MELQLEFDEYIVIYLPGQMLMGKKEHNPLIRGISLLEPRQIQLVQQGKEFGIVYRPLLGMPKRLQVGSETPWFYPTDKNLVDGYIEHVTRLTLAKGGIH
jgi:hypothetical protein